MVYSPHYSIFFSDYKMHYSPKRPSSSVFVTDFSTGFLTPSILNPRHFTPTRVGKKIPTTVPKF